MTAGRVARAGADLQDAAARFDAQRRDDERLKVGALDGLAAFDRQHAVGPGDVMELPGQKGRARRRLEGRDDLLADTAAAAQTQHEGGETLAVARHASAFVSWSRTSWAVRSSFSGVTEILRLPSA